MHTENVRGYIRQKSQTKKTKQKHHATGVSTRRHHTNPAPLQDSLLYADESVKLLLTVLGARPQCRHRQVGDPVVFVFF